MGIKRKWWGMKPDFNGDTASLIKYAILIGGLVWGASKVSGKVTMIQTELKSIQQLQNQQNMQMTTIMTQLANHQGWTDARNKQIDYQFDELQNRIERLEAPSDGYDSRKSRMTYPREKQDK